MTRHCAGCIDIHASSVTLRNESRSGCSLVFEGRGKLLLLDVVARETVNTRLDENHAAVEE